MRSKYVVALVRFNITDTDDPCALGLSIWSWVY